MKPRYYVQQTGNAWLVLDRHKIKMHNDVVVTLATRLAARSYAKQLNDENKPSATEEVQYDTRPD